MNNHVGGNERLYRKTRASYLARCREAEVPCMWCHQPFLWEPPRPTHPKAFSVEHLVPRSKGGARDDVANWGPAHFGCNSSRGNRDQSTVATPTPDPKSEEWP